MVAMGGEAAAATEGATACANRSLMDFAICRSLRRCQVPRSFFARFCSDPGEASGDAGAASGSGDMAAAGRRTLWARPAAGATRPPPPPPRAGSDRCRGSLAFADGDLRSGPREGGMGSCGLTPAAAPVGAVSCGLTPAGSATEGGACGITPAGATSSVCTAWDTLPMSGGGVLNLTASVCTLWDDMSTSGGGGLNNGARSVAPEASPLGCAASEPAAEAGASGGAALSQDLGDNRRGASAAAAPM